MLIQQEGAHLFKLAESILTTSKRSSNSWFHQLRDLCLQYRLPHPLTLMSDPLSKFKFKVLVKKRVLNYWEIKLREEADCSKHSSLLYFHPEFHSLNAPHPLWSTAGTSPYQVAMATVQAKMLSGRYRTERLMRFWTKNTQGVCLLPSCADLNVHEDLEHLLVHCASLADTRAGLIDFNRTYSIDLTEICDIVSHYCNTSNPQFSQFLVDPSCLPQVITAAQLHGEIVLHHIFRIARTWCYSLHRARLKLLGRWYN